jgi:CubicO group peptidase (beta-lactamase class C family)
MDGILQKTTGLNAKEFAIKHILTPLGIKNYYWKTYEPNNIARSGEDFRFRPIDLIRFGQLYLNEGIWNDKRLIPKDWIELSTSVHIKASEHSNYGLQWWRPNNDSPVNNPLNTVVKENDVIMASGAGGQKIWIVPHLNLVAVSTAGNRKQENKTILWDYIIKFAQDRKEHRDGG